jgi:hypothetical protein
VVDERWKVIEKGGLKEAETYQSVPSTRALVLPDVLAHLFYFSSSRDHVEGLSTMGNAGAGFFCFLSFLLPLGLCDVSFEICTVGPSFSPTCVYVFLPNECSTRFVMI